ncbi:MFS transporter [Cytobacillus sp. NCCP-133]|uniref:MFS transporter n=1 Tax=Cytobacillus sp. NCCP-133 TaxID=766848 RepID=UPI0022308D43|nr:MFS transporter [Cytobacillus sp. NCCP-133]GLB60902.1 MFS transporter [Cytobacillus sp. NCCP-133]
MKMLINLKKHTVLFAILIGAFSLVLTNSAFNILLPNFVEMYNISTVYGGWIIALYLLAMTITMPLTACIVDRLGRKKTYILGIGLYGVFSIIGGIFSQYVQTILIVRFMHGVSAGLMIPLSLVLLFDIYSKEVRGKVTGAWGMLLTIAPAVGPTFGGFIIQFGEMKHLFWINVPFALLSLILCYRQITPDTPAHRKTIRLQGIGLMVLGVGGLSLGIQMVSNQTFPGWAASALLILGAVILVRFIQLEDRQKEPLIRFRLLQNPVYAASVIMSAVHASVMFGVIFILPLMFQEVFDLSPSLTGVLFIPTAICTSLFVWIGGNLIDSGKSMRFIVYGIGLIAISILFFAFIPKGVPLILIFILMAGRGIGVGLSNMPVTTIGLNSLKDDDLHEGSTLSNTIKRLASSFSVILLSVYYDIRWHMIIQSGERPELAKWIALKEESLMLGVCMLLTLPLASFLNRSKVNEGVENVRKKTI